MSGLGGAIKSLVRVALAIFLAFLGLAVAGAIGLWAWNAYQAREAKPFEAVRDWQVDLTERLSMKLFVRTKVVTNRLFATVRFEGYPDYLSFDDNQTHGSLTLRFLDADGFELLTKPIPLNAFTAGIGADGKRAGLYTQFEDTISLNTYKRFNRISLAWSLRTEIERPVPPPIPAPKPAAPKPTTLDHCAPGLTKAERLQRLAQHGSVREKGLNEFSAGSRSVTFTYSGDSILSCN
jgi:hypothetical protein